LGQVLVRTTENAVYAVMKEIGGRDPLLDLDNKEFAVAQEQILRPLQKDLQELRVALERVWFEVKPEHEREKSLSLVEQADGEGHRACQEAFDALVFA
jgi:hypothetical protein